MRSKVVHTHRVLPTMFIILTPSFYLNESLTRWSRGWKDPASKPLLPYSRSFPKHPLPSLFRSRKYLCTLTPAEPCIRTPSSLHPFVSASFFLSRYPLSTEGSKENRTLFNYDVGATWPVIQLSWRKEVSSF